MRGQHKKGDKMSIDLPKVERKELLPVAIGNRASNLNYCLSIQDCGICSVSFGHVGDSRHILYFRYQPLPYVSSNALCVKIVSPVELSECNGINSAIEKFKNMLKF